MTKSVPSSRQTRRAAARRPATAGLPTPLLVLIAVLVILAGVIGFAVYQTVQDRNLATQPIEGVEFYPGQARGHTESAVVYTIIPPVGGEHNSTWLNCGIYAEPVVNEFAVHSLEHGAVWITYRPDLSAQDVEQLRTLVRGKNYALLSPYPDLPAPVVASAWGVQLKVESASDPRLARFLRKYMQGPQTPEPGAVCFGGTGVPIQ